MQKDSTRDYITEAFRFYAAAGKPTYDTAVQRVKQTALEKYIQLDPAIAEEQADIAVAKAAPKLLDILAVNETIKLLENGGKRHIIAAVKAVYFTSPTKPLRRGDISARVNSFSLTFPAEERTVYRWLKEARLLCAAVRGLRISEQDAALYSIVI